MSGLLTLALSMATLALLLSLVAVFACSTLLVRQTEMRRTVSELRTRQKPYRQLISDQISLVLVVEGNCFGCRERADDLRRRAERSQKNDPRFCMVHRGDVTLPSSDYITEIESKSLVSDLGIGIHPSVVVVAEDGRELARTVVGNHDALENIIAWSSEQVLDQNQDNRKKVNV